MATILLLIQQNNKQSMNIPSLISLKSDIVQKYLKYAIELTLHGNIKQSSSLSKPQKIIITKIYKNLNIICKLSIKELKQLLKSQPAYQQALGELYFDKKLNNTIYITNYDQKLPKQNELILDREIRYNREECTDVQYRIQFTISNIAKKSVMKPVVLLNFRMKDGTDRNVYFGLEQFAILRKQVAQAMKNIYSIQMRAL